MANNISTVETEWGTVIVTVREKLVPNDLCELAPGQCSVMAYLAMKGKKDPFAAIHSHGEGRLYVINATIRTPDGLYLVTGPFPNLPTTIQEAARTYAEDQLRQGNLERAQRGLPPKGTPVAEAKRYNQDPVDLDALRRKDTLDVADFGAVHWEQQLVEILGRK